jgi:hypothetical protein
MASSTVIPGQAPRLVHVTEASNRHRLTSGSSIGPAPNTFGCVGKVDHGSGNGCSTVSWDLINDASEVAPTSFSDGTHGAPSRGGEGEGDLATIGGGNPALHQARIDESVHHPGRG